MNLSSNPLASMTIAHKHKNPGAILKLQAKQAHLLHFCGVNELVWQLFALAAK